jgi:hypothetical protein
MQRVTKWAAVLECALVGMQFIPTSAKSNAATTMTGHKGEMTESQVVKIMDRSCQDCHSSSTHWPWYGHVAPVSWILARHVNRGCDKLDFSQWAGRTPSANERWGSVMRCPTAPCPSSRTGFSIPRPRSRSTTST